MLGKTCTQIDRLTDIWRDEQAEVQMERWIVIDGETDRLMDRYPDIQIDAEMDRQSQMER